MIKLVFQNIVCPSVTLSEIRVEIGSGEVTATYYPQLIKVPVFTIGSDNPENQFYMFPGSVTLEFLFPVAETIPGGIFTPSVSQSTANYLDTMDALQVYGATLYAYKQGESDPFYVSAFNKEDNGLIKASRDTLSASILFLDDYTKLQEEPNLPVEATDTYPAGGTLDTVVRLGEHIKSLFTVTRRSLNPAIVTSVQFLTKFRFKRFLTMNPDTFEYVYLQDDVVGIRNWQFYYGDMGTKAEYFVRILRSLCSYAVIDFNRILKVLPLWYDGSEVINITRDQYESEEEIEYGKIFEGLRMFCGYGGSNGNDDSTLHINYDEKDYGSVILQTKDFRGRPLETPIIRNADHVHSCYLLFSVGMSDFVKGGYSKILRYISPIDGTSSALKTDSVSFMTPFGTWNAVEKSMAEYVGSLTWDTVSNKARKIKAKLPGIVYRFGQFFTVEGFSTVFRPLKMSYDYENDQTEIVIIECTASGSILNPTSIRFNKMLRAFKYTVNIKKRTADMMYTYQDLDGNAHITDSPQLGLEQLEIKIKNVFNCGSSTAVEYDGIQLAVSDYDKRLWRGTWQYIIYIAIGKAKDTAVPASTYPVISDTNANWYLLATLPDQQINNADYYYQYIMSTRKIRTKNPFWIWVGLKSNSAPMFDGIPVWGN